MTTREQAIEALVLLDAARCGRALRHHAEKLLDTITAHVLAEWDRRADDPAYVVLAETKTSEPDCGTNPDVLKLAREAIRQHEEARRYIGAQAGCGHLVRAAKRLVDERDAALARVKEVEAALREMVGAAEEYRRNGAISECPRCPATRDGCAASRPGSEWTHPAVHHTGVSSSQRGPVNEAAAVAACHRATPSRTIRVDEQ